MRHIIDGRSRSIQLQIQVLRVRLPGHKDTVLRQQAQVRNKLLHHSVRFERRNWNDEEAESRRGTTSRSPKEQIHETGLRRDSHIPWMVSHETGRQHTADLHGPGCVQFRTRRCLGRKRRDDHPVCSLARIQLREREQHLDCARVQQEGIRYKGSLDVHRRPDRRSGHNRLRRVINDIRLIRWEILHPEDI